MYTRNVIVNKEGLFLCTHGNSSDTSWTWEKIEKATIFSDGGEVWRFAEQSGGSTRLLYMFVE